MGTKNTDLVANFEATPPTLNDVAELHGRVRIAQGTVELAAGDSDDDDIVMLAPVPSNATVPHLYIGSDTLGGSCTFNVGIYTSAGVVKDEDVFATAVADAAGLVIAPIQVGITTLLPPWQRLVGPSERCRLSSITSLTNGLGGFGPPFLFN